MPNPALAEIYLQSLLTDSKDMHRETTSEAHSDLLARAARLASGGQAQSKAAAVSSIFSGLNWKSQQGEHKVYARQPLHDGASYFPGERGIAGGQTLQNELEKLFQTTKDNATRAETLLHLLHKHGTTIPSGYGEDVSLYDFARSKAAIAVCLSMYESGNKAEGDTPFRLVGGGISGIQRFLYDIISKNASKNLKGRSYYLHLLVDSVITRLLETFGLFQANVVYASGGGFQILAPNTADVLGRLDALRDEFGDALFEHHRTGLNLELDSIPLSEELLLQRQIGIAQNALFGKIAQQKGKRFNRQIFHRFDDLFSPVEKGGQAVRDAVSGDELALEDNYYVGEPQPRWQRKDEVISGSDWVGADTAAQIFLGRELRSVNRRFVFKGEAPPKRSEDYFDPCDLSVTHFFELDKKAVQFAYAINNPDFLSLPGQGDTVRGFEWYGGNEVPQIEVETESKPQIKTFSELAGQRENDREYVTFEEPSFKRLAILRMDVDNLGTTFQEAFREEGTLARYSALSRHLDWFFKGYLNTLWESDAYYSKNIQIVYAGGDDLFIVGRWDATIQFARSIRNEFRRWTCGHPAFGLSGGLVMVTPKFPVAKAAEWCEEEEKKAKSHRFSIKTDGKEKAIWEKDSFSLLGLPLHWDYELDLVEKLKDKLEKLFEVTNNKALLMEIQAFEELRKFQEANKLAESWRWQLAYQMARAKKRLKNEEAEQILDILKDGVFTDKCAYTVESKYAHNKTSRYSFLTLLSLAARWLELEMRMKN
ncbi:MAG TPA: type III-A CRISPR-associated protein Cas10/Csm1 [Saprospiraceae bacterium]|nr:type III-A CRISPR-associated protein Cas10/Csm1 [Saprospiraceae bacterium]